MPVPTKTSASCLASPARICGRDPVRSGIGRFGKRPDLAVLVLVLVFGAFANAAGMISPVVEWQERLRSVLGNCSALLVTSLYYLLGLLVLPLLAVGSVAVLSRWWGQLGGDWLDVATRFSYSLLPLGFGMWLSHYSFHFLGSYETVVPAMQRFVGDLGLHIFLASRRGASPAVVPWQSGSHAWRSFPWISVCSSRCIPAIASL